MINLLVYVLIHNLIHFFFKKEDNCRIIIIDTVLLLTVKELMLKDKLQHIKIFKSLFECTSIPIWQHHTENAEDPPLTGAGGEVFTEKTQRQSKEIIWLAIA